MEVTERTPSLFDLGLCIQLFPTEGPHVTKIINGVVVAAYDWNTPCGFRITRQASTRSR